jgi:antitoxin (DNA-binding transcriptional repressor) of toxin-antitoxin stability system
MAVAEGGADRMTARTEVIAALIAADPEETIPLPQIERMADAVLELFLADDDYSDVEDIR